MAAPTIINTKTTTATKYGGDALNFVNQYLNGVDVTSDIGTPIIRTPTKIPSDILKFTDPEEDNTVTVKVPTLSANKTINLVPTNVEADDEVLYKDTVQTVTGKVISAGTNTITDLTNDNLSGSAGITDPNLAQITDKSKLPSTAVYTTDSQILTNKTVNLTNNTVTDTSRALGDLVKDNGTKYARFPRGTDTQVLKSDATDVVWGAVAYTELTDIPTEFTPEAHDHDADYSPLGHLHAYADITDKPTEFTPEAHNHAASEITSGTLAVAQGGTNKSTITEHALLKGGATNTYSEIAPGIDGKIIKMVSGTPAWADESGGTLTDVNNVGTGAGLVFRDVVTGEINLKTIKAGTNVTVTNNADDVTIASSGTGGGAVVIDDLTDVDTSTVAPSSNDVLTWNSTDAEWVPAPPPGASGGEANTSSNVGLGEGTLAKSKVGVDLPFKSLKQGTNIQLSNNADDVTINAAHNHDTAYSDINHHHDADYADIAHNHDTDYAAINHNHKLDDLQTPDDNTDLDASQTAHGLLQKLSGSSGDVLRGDGTWGAGGSGAPTDAQYITLATNGSLSAERTLEVSKGLKLTDGGAGNAVTIEYNPIERAKKWITLESDMFDSDFFTPFNSLVSGTGAAISTNAVVSEPGHPGITRFSTGTATTGIAAIFDNSGGFIIGEGEVTYITIAKIPTLSTTTQNFNISYGLGNGVHPALFSNAIYFKYNNDINLGKWQIITEDNSTETVGDSGVAADTGWNVFKIVVNASGTSASFYINGVETSNSPITTNIPTGSSKHVSYNFNIDKDAGTTSRDLYCDFLGVYQELTTGRFS